MQDDKRAESYEKIMQYQRGLHEKNQMRIKTGIKLVIIIPLIFLIIMFKQDSSKVIFLILWIVSLFAISAYLIAIEYMDYQVQLKLNEWGISDNDEIKNLLNDDSRVEQMIRSSGILDTALPLETPQSDLKNDNLVEINSVPTDLLRSEKYVHALGAQTVQQNAIQIKTPQDYAQMKREKALDKQKAVCAKGVRRNED